MTQCPTGLLGQDVLVYQLLGGRILGGSATRRNETMAEDELITTKGLMAIFGSAISFLVVTLFGVGKWWAGRQVKITDNHGKRIRQLETTTAVILERIDKNVERIHKHVCKDEDSS